MTDTELIKWQAKKIVDQEISIEYYQRRCAELEKNSFKSAPLSFEETVSALAHAEVKTL